MTPGNRANVFLIAIFLVQAVLVSAKVPDWVTQEMLDMIASDKAACMKEHDTTQAMIDRVNEGEMPEEKNFACYMFCLFDAFSVVDEDGILEAEILTSFLPDSIQAKAGDILGSCAEQDGADVCEKMQNIAKCVQAKDPSMWFML